uniref:Uncharacterized protein n=1 Tax=Oryza sativa subsp. japonica TaxID=39947 RepID=Q5TKC4_ORYSJ|nr:hypothetical protein [Oryza sativa Japonica Group]
MKRRISVTNHLQMQGIFFSYRIEHHHPCRRHGYQSDLALSRLSSQPPSATFFGAGSSCIDEDKVLPPPMNPHRAPMQNSYGNGMTNGVHESDGFTNEHPL